MPTRLQPAESHVDRLHHRAQRRAVWEFAATVENWRCVICFGRIAYEDHELFDRTKLCVACSDAVNESFVLRSVASDQEA